MDDSELLSIVQTERRASIGFDQDSVLVGDREKALNYYRGEMPDIPALENRSKAISTDVADAIETVLPDLMEIFTGGDDVLAFTPTNPDDEKKAQQETDYLQHVVFSDNAGFLAIYSALKDALLTKTGVITWWWDAKKGESREEFTGQDAMTVAFLKAQGAQIEDLKVSDGYDEANAQSDPTYDFTVVKPGGRVCLKAV